MNWKKRIARYAKRFLYPIISGCIAFFLVRGINLILNHLEPGPLIIFLIPIAQVALPLCVAFRSFCIRMYKEAEEDGELEEILKNTPPLFKRRAKPEPQADYPSDIHQESATWAAGDCIDPFPPAHDPQEIAPQDAAQQIIAEAEGVNAQNQISEPAISTNQVDPQPEPIPEIPPDPKAHPAEDGPDNPPEELSISATTPEEAPDLCNDDVIIDEVPCNDQETDVFDRIRDPEIVAHYIVLDIETTGFNRDNDKIIEIAAIHYVFGEEATRFHTYINPQMQIPKHITRLTGIQQCDVDDAPFIEDIADDFREFIKDYPLVGHNIVDFDIPFLKAHLSLDEPHFIIDTLDMARSAFPLLPSHKLSDLNHWFHLNNGDPHRADADAAATNALMWACLYPEKHRSLYRRAIRNGPPKAEHAPKSKPLHSDWINITDITPSQSQNNNFKPLLGKKIVFTGELSIPRREAMQMAVDAGATLRSSVSSRTDILVVGEQDLSVVGSDGLSTKQEKALEVNASGKGSVKIINEAEFVSMVSPVSESGTI